MTIELYNTLIHPLADDHSPAKTAFSVITNVALTVLTLGVYALVFAGAHIYEWCLTGRVEKLDEYSISEQELQSGIVVSDET